MIRKARQFVQIVAVGIMLLVALQGVLAAILPSPNGLLDVDVKQGFTPDPALVGQQVHAGFGLMFTSKTYRQEAQTQGIAEQKLTIQFRGGGGVITGVRLTGTILIPNSGKLVPFAETFRGLEPGQTRLIAPLGLTASLNSAGDELVLSGQRGSAIILCVEPQGFFTRPGEKLILLNAQILPMTAAKAAVGQAAAQGQVKEQELTYKIVLKATPGENGEFQYKSMWELSQASPKGGFIIQLVDFTWAVEDKAGKEVNPNIYFLALFQSNPKMFDAGWYPYLEAYEVQKGQKVSTLFEDSVRKKVNPPFDDLIQAPGFKDEKMPITKGTLTLKLRAKFYEGMALPKDFKVQNPPAGAPPAGALPVKLSIPIKDAKLPDGGSNEVRRVLIASWDSTKGKFIVPTDVEDRSPTKPAK